MAINNLAQVLTADGADRVPIHSVGAGQDASVALDDLPVSAAMRAALDALDAEKADDEGAVVVYTTDAPATASYKIATLNGEVEATSPLGRGKPVKIKPGKVQVLPNTSISTMQTLLGVKGSSQLCLNTAIVAPTGTTGMLVLADDSLAKNGIRGNGVIRDLDMNGQITDFDDWETEFPGVTVHGYYAPDRSSGKCISHRVDNSATYNFPGVGFYIGSGNDQLVANRLRSEGCRDFAMVIKSSDVKAHDLGLTGRGGALKIDGAAPEIDTVDLFIPTDFEGECTLHIINGARTQIKGGTVEGRTIIDGRNDQGTGARLESSGILLADLAFKHDEDLNATRYYSGPDQIYVYDSYLECIDVDDVRLRAPRFGFNNERTPAELPDYLIKLSTTTGNTTRIGTVFIDQPTGMINFTGRAGDPNGLLPRMGCKKHFCNRPDLIVFDWGTLGQVEEVAKSICDHTDGRKTHLKCDGATYNKADYPFGYLAVQFHKGIAATLDDVNTTFTMPTYAAKGANTYAAIRVVP